MSLNKFYTTSILLICTSANAQYLNYEVYAGCEHPATSYTRDFVVDPILGSDSGDGSKLQPYKTLQLAFARKKILPGDRVVLMPGDHGHLLISRYSNPEFVNSTKWTALDFKSGAKAKTLSFRDVSKFLVTQADLNHNTGNLFSASNGSHVILADSNLYTTKDSSSFTVDDWINGLKIANGISYRNVTCGSILRNKFLNIRFGMQVGKDCVPLSTDPKKCEPNAALYSIKTIIKGNEIRNFSADGIRPNASDISVSYNKIYDSYVSIPEGDGNHDDGIQMFALNGVQFENILFEGNYIQESTSVKRKYNSGLQGIGLFDGIISNMNIRKNVILVSAYHGIGALGIKNSVIENNTVANPLWDRNGSQQQVKTWIAVLNSKGGVPPQNVNVRNNLAAKVFGVNSVNFTSNYEVTEPLDNYTTFDIVNSLFNLRPKLGSVLYGKEVGALLDR